MKFNNLFFMALVLVLICSCKDTTLCYKIPLDNKELTCKDRIVYENIEYSHIKERRDNT